MQHTLKTCILLTLLVLLSGLFPPAQPTLAASLVVTTTNPTGPGSLGDAIAQANSSPEPDTITFNLPAGQVVSGGYWQITVSDSADQLPPLTGGNITIDASTQPGGRSDGGPKVVLATSDPVAIIGSAFVLESANNTIKGFVINNWGGSGIFLEGTAASGNKILGNYIGTDWSGNSAVPNNGPGIAVRDGASNNQIGGLNTGERNVISGNGDQASYGQVTISSFLSTPGEEMSGNVVENNYIGTNAAGNAALPGSSHGVILGNNAISNIIGPRNVISGNSPPKDSTPARAFGINISGEFTGSTPPSNVIKGNLIGLAADGTTALPNGISGTGGGGIRVSQGIDANDPDNKKTVGSNNVIGGSDITKPDERNVIAGNASGNEAYFYGILIDSQCGDGSVPTSTKVQNNFIGLNATGTAAVPNMIGVGIAGNENFSNPAAPCNNLIGPGNVISGNGRDGVRIDGVMQDGTLIQPKNNSVQGNLIGTNPSGTATIPNKDNGVYLRAGVLNSTVTSNLISGNGIAGVLLGGYPDSGSVNAANAPSGNTISNNKIGTNGAGDSALGNAAAGVQLQKSAHDNVIGPDNLISGQNSQIGVGVLMLDSGTTANKVIGSNIGTNAQATGGIPNTYGVQIVGGASGNSVGDNAAKINQISYNGTYGVVLASSNNQLANSNLTHNLNDGVTVQNSSGNRITHTTTAQNGGNGIGLANNGNNNLQAPTLTLGGNTLTGTAAGCANCVIEIYTNDTSGDAGEGNVFLSDTTRTDGSGNFSVSLPISGCKPFLIATVTDASNNTSPFSNQVGPATPCEPTAANITLSAANPSSLKANPGQTVTYVHTLSNSGTAAGTVVLSLSSTQGWATLVPNQTMYTLNPGESATITVQVVVPANAPGGVVDQTILKGDISGGGSVSQTDTTTVNQIFGFDFGPTGLQGNATPGTSVDYTHYITNTGNGVDTFTLSAANTGAGVTVSFPDCTPSCDVAAGQSRSVIVRVTVAGNSNATSDVATITATSKGGATKQVVDTTQIQQVPIPSLSPPAATASGKPGTTVRFVHTLKNVGAASGTFSLTASTPPSGWTVAVQPAGTFTLGPNETKSVTLTVTIPASPAPDSSLQVPVTLTASAGAGNPTAQAIDTVTVLLAPALNFVPDRSGSGAVGQTVSYTHYITNTGNGQETFNFTSSAPTGWGVTVVDAGTLQPITSVTLKRNEGRTVIGQVTIPTSSPVASTIFITATASTDASVKASVKDTTTIVSSVAVPQLDAGKTVSTDPGVGVTINHTVTNVGDASGSFTYTLEQLPAGWTSSITQTPTGSLPPSGTAALTVIVTPTANTSFGSYAFRLRATAQDTNKATTSVVDTVNVNKKVSLVIAPPYNDLRDPGTVVTYTHTLTNSGNFTDTVTLAARSSLPWAVQVVPASTTLAPGATRRVTVTLTIPSGLLAGTVNTTTITATSSQPGVQATVQDKTTIRAVPGVQLTPPFQLLGSEAARPITFTFKLLNTGSVSQSYTLAATPPPAGWTAVPIPLSVSNIQPGQQVEIQLVVTAPAGTPDGTVGDTTLRATSSVAPTNPAGPPPSATATARLIVGPAFKVDIAPDRSANVQPAQIYRYSHVVTNTGLFTDTFLLTTRSRLGWETSVTPSSLTLPPGATAPVTMTVVVPVTAQASVVEVTQVIARSATHSDVFDSVTDTSTVLRVSGVSISPNLSRTASDGTQVEFQHRVVNTGNNADTFDISVTSTQNWSVTIVPTTTPELAPGFSYPVLVRVTIPKGTPLSTLSTITVRATSRFNTNTWDEARDRLSTPAPITNAPVPSTYRLYLPLVIKAKS